MSTFHPARYVALVARLLESRGLDGRPLLESAGVNPERLAQGDVLIPLSTIGDLVKGLEQASDQADLFVASGLSCGFQDHGDMGLAMLSCQTLRESIEFTAQHFPLITPAMSMTVTVSRGVVEIVWQPILGMPRHLLTAMFDFIAGAFHKRLKLMLDDALPPYLLAFSSPAPADARRYQGLAPAVCRFDQGGLPRLVLKIDAQVLNKPMPLAHPPTHQQALERARLRLSALGDQKDWKAWISMMLQEAVGRQPSMEELADMANISVSTLARHLAAQGCTFRQLANDIRHQRACTMLSQNGMRPGDIAHSLGYIHVGNFIRAFRLKAGMTPMDYFALRHQEPAQLASMALSRPSCLA